MTIYETKINFLKYQFVKFVLKNGEQANLITISASIMKVQFSSGLKGPT